ncbi:ATP-binding protein [Alsobacter sp. KACC 23698]|uniref:histidine kinase n=1 Tax=Alsobacter sp. KACC 23698 TaxID=3149229 RepID=A0AAU7JAP0_9HYPH
MRALRLLVILSVLAPVVLLAVLGWVSYRTEVRTARRGLLQTLDLVYEHAIKTFDTHRLVATYTNEVVRGLADEEIQTREAELRLQLARLVAGLPQLTNTWVIDALGQPLVSASPVPAGLNVSDRAYFQTQLQPGARPHVSQLLLGKATGSVFFQLAWRREDPGGRFRGVTAVSVEPDYFRAFHGRVTAGAGYTMGLFRNDGVALVRYPTSTADLLGTRQRATGLEKEIAERPGAGLYFGTSNFDGERRLVAYRSMPDYPIYVTAGLPWSSVVRAWRGAMLSYLAFGAPSAMALFLLSVSAYRQARRENATLDKLRQEAKRRELAEDALRQSQKMEAVGRLTGGIAHDFNNLLTVVIGNLEMLLRRLGPEDARARRSALLAKEGALRAAMLTQRLLAFSRRQPLEPRRVDLNQLVRGMTELVHRTLGEKISVQTRTEPDLPAVDVDPNQLESAILNLAVNARDAMPQGGELVVSTARVEVEADGGAAPPGSYVAVSVSDTGSGIPAELQDKVFEPFFTTKPHGQGTGLGLSQVYGFIQQSGGHVLLTSEPGHGATITMLLPLAPPSLDEAPTHGPEIVDAAPSAPTSTILVVEDQPEVRRFAVEALRELGHHVVEAGDAEQAIRMLGEGPSVSLLFSDIGLPGMDGRALARHVAAHHPRIRILLTTGYANLRDGAGPGDPDLDPLPKPYTVAQLVTRVDAVLRGPEGTLG